ncbi:MAG: tRNA pseudouridine(55) synthase TruB [Bacteroidota bacterium]
MDPNAPPVDPGKVWFIDKPLNWTSFDVVKKLRGCLKIKKIGHAGTLDPLATGLLILCSGRKTKEIESYQGMEKEYTGIMRIGQTTPSFDLETKIDSNVDFSHVSLSEINEAVDKLTGEISQIPPAYSAVKVDGKRAYKSARKGESIELKPRRVLIKTFNVETIDLPKVHFRIICSKGTYIRSIARDFGEHLDVGAHLIQLRRERIGPYHVDEAETLENIIADENLSRY